MRAILRTPSLLIGQRVVIKNLKTQARDSSDAFWKLWDYRK